MPSKTLVKQIDLEIGEARGGISQLEAEVERLQTAREALVPSAPTSSNGADPQRATRRRKPSTRRTRTQRRKSAKPAASRRVPGVTERMIAERLLLVSEEPFTVPAFYAEHGEGRWNQLTTFQVFKRLEQRGMVARAGKDGTTQLWRPADRQKLAELVAA